MLEKGGYDTWQSRMLLYVEGKEHGKMLLDSILKGPFEYKVVDFPANEALGIPAKTTMRTFKDLSPEDKIRKECDIRAANTNLHGLPNDIYTLLNRKKTANEIWHMVKELMERTELTKQEKDSKLVDEFDRFTLEKGDMIHSYYIRFSKLKNDINILRLHMTPLQVISNQNGVDAYDSDVDDVPTVSAMFMAKLSLDGLLMGMMLVRRTIQTSYLSTYSSLLDVISRDVITVGSTMRNRLLYRGEYSQWSERFMNYLEEQTDGEAMTNSIQNEKKTRKIDRLARSLLIQGLPNDIYSLMDSKETSKDLWDALERQMRSSEYGEQDRKAVILYEYKTFKEWKQYGTLMRQTKNLMDINIDALYNILKQNQGDVNDALGYTKKAVVVTSDPLALVAEKMKITALLAKAFNRKKYYAKPTNNNLRTSSASSSANKKPEYVKSVEKKDDKKADEKKRDMSKVKSYNCKKANVKDYNYYKTKMLLAKKDSDEQVLLDEDQAWMESSSDSDQEINANMVFMAQIKKVLSDSDESSSSAEETIAE
nr:hypothetical protein [Tanacetum cinerariifolium]